MDTYLIIGGIILLVLVLLYAAIKLDASFREKAYKLFIYAENHLDEGKMDYCVEHIYAYLPAPFKMLPASFYRWLLQKAFDEIKDLLDDGRINNSPEPKEEVTEEAE